MNIALIALSRPLSLPLPFIPSRSHPSPPIVWPSPARSSPSPHPHQLQATPPPPPPQLLSLPPSSSSFRMLVEVTNLQEGVKRRRWGRGCLLSICLTTTIMGRKTAEIRGGVWEGRPRQQGVMGRGWWVAWVKGGVRLE